ncbi:hypothetical protein [Schaalia vaccimaxillae]|uniref:hypothetical protein n=1 Tax=Schaalia vaccimaxillae TaxID=183916 RepID=UPI00103C4021|nr:hypothetical protein [Schaalia vaccimaxillae]
MILGAALVMGFSGVVLSSTTIGSREIETLPQGDLDAGLAFSARKAVVVGWMLRTCLVLSAAAMMVVAVFQLLGSGPPAMIMMVLLAGLIIPLFGPVVARLGLVRTFMSRFAQDPDAGGQQTGKARSSNLIPTRIRPAWSGFVIPGQALSSRITAKAEEWDRAPSVDLVLEAGNGNRRSRTITCIEVMSLWIVLVWGLLNRADMLEDVYIPGHALAALLIAFPMWVLAVFRGPFGYIATYRQRTRGAFIKKVPPRTNGQDKLALLGSWFVILLTAATISATLWDQHLWRFDNLFMITTAVTCCIASVPWAIAKIVNHYHRWSFLKDSRYISPYA